MTDRITKDNMTLHIKEINLSGSISLGDASPAVYKNTAKRINKYLEKQNLDWRVKANPKRQSIEPYTIPGGLTASEKHEFAEKLIDWLSAKEYFYGVNIYTGTCRYTDTSEYKPENNFEQCTTQKGTEYIKQPYNGCPCEYHNPNTLTITFEGPLYDAFNYHAFESTNEALDKIAEPYKLYNEQGYAWSTSFYPHCEYPL